MSRSSVESCKVNKVNPLTYLTYVLSHVRDKRVTLWTPDEFTISSIATSGNVLFNNSEKLDADYRMGSNRLCAPSSNRTTDRGRVKLLTNTAGMLYEELIDRQRRRAGSEFSGSLQSRSDGGQGQ